MAPLSKFKNTNNARGLTFTETLTALLLLGIGLLCIASVYLERSQAAPAVLLHSKANRLAQEMAEHMRSQQAAGVRFENPVGTVCQADLNLAQIQTRSPQLATQFQQQKLIDNEVSCWQEKIAQTLPNGAGAISIDSTNKPPAFLITVSWSPPGGGTASYLLRLEHLAAERAIKPTAPPAGEPAGKTPAPRAKEKTTNYVSTAAREAS